MSAIPTIDPSQLTSVFVPRLTDSNKGTYGAVGILGGAPGMTGAALLAARAALYMGAGKVFIGFAQGRTPMSCDPNQPEILCLTGHDLLDRSKAIDVWVAGCGGSTCADMHALLQRLFSLARATSLILDADALNLIAANRLRAEWPAESTVILTPHPGEAARLLGQDTHIVQDDRPGAARALAHRLNAWIVLKGVNTVVCSPAGELRVNTTGNPGLASGGTGDTLAGMIGGLVAQPFALRDAVEAAVWLHGAAADSRARTGDGPIGFTASEIAPEARRLLNQRAYGGALTSTSHPGHTA